MSSNEISEEIKTTETKDEKPYIETKSSMEILSELFSTFDAEPPVIVKKEKDPDQKKHKKSKKKHKHKDRKDKKHKKKSKKKRSKKSDDSSSSENEGIDLSDIIKTEITETSLLSDTLQNFIKTEIKQEVEKTSDVATDKKIIDNSTETIKAEIIEENDKVNKKLSKTKITIKDINVKSLLKNDKDKKIHKRKKRNDKDRSEVPSKKSKTQRSRSRSRSHSHSRSQSKEKSRKDKRSDSKHHTDKHDKHNKYDEFDKYDKYKDESHHSMKYKSDKHDYRHKTDFYKEKDDYRHRSERRYDSRDSRDDDFYNNYKEDRFKDRFYDRKRISRSSEKETRFDKKKLLEIARKNAIQMMKSGKLSGALNLGPQAQEKVIAAISGGGKTVEELTDFCKTLSKKEELGELSSVSSEQASESEEEDMTIRHPFQIKEKSFTINIKNSVSLPTRTNQERASELRIQFPVSSGQHHRKTESEWVPVEPKKDEVKKTTSVTTPAAIIAPLAIEPPPKPVVPPVVVSPVVNMPNMQLQPLIPQNLVPFTPQVSQVPQVPHATQVLANKPSEQEIASIVSQRLSAMRKLQENPNDSQAIMEMYRAQKGMNNWAESKLPFGQFTGTTGANILSQAQLSSGYQAWARKDQLQTAAPLSGGMGMHLLQKMGWRPGEGLGKEKSGTLEPLLLEVKLDKKGVIAKEECKKKMAIKIPKQTVKTLEGKHPVSLLHEYSSKKKYKAPDYILDFECGPDHMKNFLFKVRVNGVEYKPNVASGNKKEAKALAATICLQELGLWPG